MKELVDLFDEIQKMRDDVLIENIADNDLVDAYNQGVNAMTMKLRCYLNQKALETAFGGHTDG